jgi:dTDP-4-dehydrorhamnose reductase
MKLLLLGKQGQLGHELQTSLSSLGEVIALGREDLDLTDLQALARVIQKESPDVIVNAAAYTAVDKAETERTPCYLLNAIVPEIIAIEAERIGALVVHYSTDYVFDGSKKTPYIPDDAPNPINYYGYSKLQGEARIAVSGCDYLIFRTSWVYHDSYGHNFYRTMQRLASEREELRVVADQQGIPNNAVDLANETARILAHPLDQLREKCGIYHLTADLSHQTTWFAFAQSIIASMPEESRKCQRIVPISTEDYPTPAQRPMWSVMQRVLPSFSS